MICQQQDDEIEAGIEHLHQLYNVMRNDKRERGQTQRTEVWSGVRWF